MNSIKKIVMISVLAVVTGCGYASVDNELICQPKKIYHRTPMLCPLRNDVDVSMGVMRDGVGSMSAQDIYMTVPSAKDLATIETAIQDGKLVKIHYNEFRVAFCQQDETVTSVEIVEGAVKTEQEKKQKEIDDLTSKLQHLQGK